MAGDEGGYLIPDAVMQRMMDSSLDSMQRYLKGYEKMFGPLAPAKPLTLRQKLSLKRDRAIGWLHDRLFGSDYCDHDGCY